MTGENARKDRGNSNSELIERLEDGLRCHDCGRDAVVPVKDEKMDGSSKRGNPFRMVCIACEKNVRMTSKENWEEHEDRFVLTPEDDVVPVFNCPSCGELVEGQPDECPECGMSYNW